MSFRHARHVACCREEACCREQTMSEGKADAGHWVVTHDRSPSGCESSGPGRPTAPFSQPATCCVTGWLGAAVAKGTGSAAHSPVRICRLPGACATSGRHARPPGSPVRRGTAPGWPWGLGGSCVPHPVFAASRLEAHVPRLGRRASLGQPGPAGGDEPCPPGDRGLHDGARVDRGAARAPRWETSAPYFCRLSLIVDTRCPLADAFA
jgi:hypothetical protein